MNELVTLVGRRLAAAADRPDYRWEFVVLENPQETLAFCFPGGQSGIFTGALKYTRDEAGLPRCWPMRWAMPWPVIPESARARPRWPIWGAWVSAWQLAGWG